MNREVHVRFWERPEVKFLRATRQERRYWPWLLNVGFSLTADASLRCGERKVRAQAV